MISISGFHCGLAELPAAHVPQRLVHRSIVVSTGIFGPSSPGAAGSVQLGYGQGDLLAEVGDQHDHADVKVAVHRLLLILHRYQCIPRSRNCIVPVPLVWKNPPGEEVFLMDAKTDQTAVAWYGWRHPPGQPQPNRHYCPL